MAKKGKGSIKGLRHTKLTRVRITKGKHKGKWTRRWKGKKPKFRRFRGRYKDSDGDGVSDRFDCEPHNPRRQDVGGVYRRIYNKLDRLGILDVKEAHKFKSKGFMDLNIDVLSETPDIKHIAMAHNYIQMGDVMADPDMEVRIYKKTKMAEALTYQQDALGIYQRVYIDDKVNLKAKKELNTFLDKWLTNLIRQGFGKTDKPKKLTERRGMTTEEEIRQATQSGAFKRESAKYRREVKRELRRVEQRSKVKPKSKREKHSYKPKILTSKEKQDILSEIDRLDKANKETRRLAFGRGYGYGSDIIEKRRNKIEQLRNKLFLQEIFIKDRQTGESYKREDLRFKAKRPGKRVSKGNRVYYERRANRSDINPDRRL